MLLMMIIIEKNNIIRNMNTRKMVFYVNEQTPIGKTTNLGVSWTFMPATNFYITTGQAPKVNLVKWDKEIRKDTFYDYYYIYKTDRLEINSAYRHVKSFGDYQLYKRRN